MFGFICELLGAIVVGGYLLIMSRHLSFEVLFPEFWAGEQWTLSAGVSGVERRGDVLLLRV